MGEGMPGWCRVFHLEAAVRGWWCPRAVPTESLTGGKGEML